MAKTQVVRENAKCNHSKARGQSRFGHIFVDLFCKQVLQLPNMY